MANKKIIKRALNRALRARGLKQIWLADKIGIHDTTLSRWANAEHLSTQKIEKITKVLGMSVVEFLASGE